MIWDLWYTIWHKSSERASCLMISLSQYLNLKHMKEMEDYLRELRRLKEQETTK